MDPQSFKVRFCSRTTRRRWHAANRTTVHLFEPNKGPVEQVASFHCIPRPNRIVGKFTIKTRPNVPLGFGCVLTEYQFAGDTEAHGVPVPVSVEVQHRSDVYALLNQSH